MLSAQQMQSLPKFFADIPDPRRAQGRRHRLSTVLAIAAGATLCGMHGYLAISDWAKSLGQKARRRFGCRYRNGRYIVSSLSIIRDVLIRGVVYNLHLARLRSRNGYHVDTGPFHIVQQIKVRRMQPLHHCRFQPDTPQWDATVMDRTPCK